MYSLLTVVNFNVAVFAETAIDENICILRHNKTHKLTHLCDPIRRVRFKHMFIVFSLRTIKCVYR